MVTIIISCSACLVLGFVAGIAYAVFAAFNR